ncbi:MAG TPA: hypothetical protein VIV83_13005 [Gemmatimonadales bacterium]
MSRREFLGWAAAAALPIQMKWGLKYWMVDPAGTLALPESLLGYRRALPADQEVNLSVRQAPHGGLVVFPSRADRSLRSQLPDLIGLHLSRGSTVILESGAGFLNRVDYRVYRRWMRERLRIEVTDPVDLWSGAARGVPYIEYDWPMRASVRDYSRVVPLADQPGEVIGWAGGIAVALKRRVGMGTLVYLGSPLGPALWADDQQARRLLLQLLAT